MEIDSAKRIYLDANGIIRVYVAPHQKHEVLKRDFVVFKRLVDKQRAAGKPVLGMCILDRRAKITFATRKIGFKMLRLKLDRLAGVGNDLAFKYLIILFARGSGTKNFGQFATEDEATAYLLDGRKPL